MVSRFFRFLDSIFGMADFTNLVVWQKANRLSVATASGLEKQLRGAEDPLSRFKF